MSVNVEYSSWAAKTRQRYGTSGTRNSKGRHRGDPEQKERMEKTANSSLNRRRTGQASGQTESCT